jgi:hypothetical protein
MLLCRLCWLPEPSVKNMKGLISSLTSYFATSHLNGAQPEEGYTLGCV